MALRRTVSKLFAPSQGSALRCALGLSSLSQRAIMAATVSRYSARRGFSTQKPKTVTLIKGEGIGPEISDSVLGVFQAAEVPVVWEHLDLHNFSSQNDEVPASLISSFHRTKVALKGPLITDPRDLSASRNVKIRNALNLFANVVPIFSVSGIAVRQPDKNINMVVIRENSQGEYMGMENEVVPGVVQSIKLVTRESSLRIAKFAFTYAVEHGRNKVTAVHKANIQKLTDGLFLESCREVAKNYPQIAYNELIIDNTCMQLVMNPTQFDVMVMPNLYGNIVANVATGLVGGPGLIPGYNVGLGGEATAGVLFEPGARHAAVDIAGKNVANPTAMLFSAVMMLRTKRLDLGSYADVIEAALLRVIGDHRVVTRDMGGQATTKEFTEAVIREVVKIRKEGGVSPDFKVKQSKTSSY